jgi:hypothetical protein
MFYFQSSLFPLVPDTFIFPKWLFPLVLGYFIFRSGYFRPFWAALFSEVAISAGFREL